MTNIRGYQKVMSRDKPKINEEDITCILCSQIYAKPKRLPCHHTFCQICLEPSVHSGYVECPLCYNQSPVYSNNTDSLPNDGYILQLLDKYRDSKVSKGSLICDICAYSKKHTEAAKYCVNCSKHLCVPCGEQHLTKACFSAHMMVDVGHTDTAKCSKHGTEYLSLYCSTCQALVCVVCVMTDCASHTSTAITHATHTFQEAVQYNIKAAHRSLDGDIANKFMCILSMKEVEMEEVKEAVEKQAQDLIDRVEHCKTVTLEHIDETMAQFKQSVYDEIRKVEADRKKVSKMSSASEPRTEIQKVHYWKQKLENVNKDIDAARDKAYAAMLSLHNTQFVFNPSDLSHIGTVETRKGDQSDLNTDVLEEELENFMRSRQSDDYRHSEEGDEWQEHTGDSDREIYYSDDNEIYDFDESVPETADSGVAINSATESSKDSDLIDSQRENGDQGKHAASYEREVREPTPESYNYEDSVSRDKGLDSQEGKKTSAAPPVVKYIPPSKYNNSSSQKLQNKKVDCVDSQKPDNGIRKGEADDMDDELLEDYWPDDEEGYGPQPDSCKLSNPKQKAPYSIDDRRSLGYDKMARGNQNMTAEDKKMYRNDERMMQNDEHRANKGTSYSSRGDDRMYGVDDRMYRGEDRMYRNDRMSRGGGRTYRGDNRMYRGNDRNYRGQNRYYEKTYNTYDGPRPFDYRTQQNNYVSGMDRSRPAKFPPPPTDYNNRREEREVKMAPDSSCDAVLNAACDVEFLPDDWVVVACGYRSNKDRRPLEGRLVLYDKYGNLQSVLEGQQYNIYPKCMAYHPLFEGLVVTDRKNPVFKIVECQERSGRRGLSTNKQVKLQGLDSPSGITVLDDGKIAVSQIGLRKEHTVGIHELDGILIRSIGHNDKLRQEFSWPHYITVDNNNRILVADQGHNNIKIFDKDLQSFLKKIKIYSGVIEGIATDESGNIWVANGRNGYVIYSPDGRLICRTNGSDSPAPDYAMDLAFNAGCSKLAAVGVSTLAVEDYHGPKSFKW